MQGDLLEVVKAGPKVFGLFEGPGRTRLGAGWRDVGPEVGGEETFVMGLFGRGTRAENVDPIRVPIGRVVVEISSFEDDLCNMQTNSEKVSKFDLRRTGSRGHFQMAPLSGEFVSLPDGTSAGAVCRRVWRADAFEASGDPSVRRGLGLATLYQKVGPP